MLVWERKEGQRRIYRADRGETRGKHPKTVVTKWQHVNSENNNGSREPTDISRPLIRILGSIMLKAVLGSGRQEFRPYLHQSIIGGC